MPAAPKTTAADYGISPATFVLGKFVRALTRYGWLVIAAVLLAAGALHWLAWKTVLIAALVSAALILLSPVLLGVIVALDSRRLDAREQA